MQSMRFYALCGLCLLAVNASAYVGPGADLELSPSLIMFAIAVLVALIAVVVIPIYYFRKSRNSGADDRRGKE